MQSSPRTHTLSVLQIILSGLGILGYLGLGALALLGSLVSVFMAQESLQDAQVGMSFAWICALVVALLVPSIVYAALRLAGKPIVARPAKRLSFWLALIPILWIGALWVGSLLADTDAAFLMLPPLQIILLAIPLWLLFTLAQRQLDFGGLQKAWGVISFGVLITLILVIVVEFAILFLGAMLLIFVFSADPSVISAWQSSVQNFQIDPNNFNQISQTLESILTDSTAVFGLLGFTSVIVPLIEELLKPLALWFFAGKNLRPSQGFALGAVSGAVFALFESLGTISGTTGSDWTILVVQRCGTGILHVTCSALVGWGLVSAWSQRKYLRLGLLYLAAVALHGAWNAFGIFMGFMPFLTVQAADRILPSVAVMGNAGGVVLIVLAVGMVGILFLVNRRLQKEEAQRLPAPVMEFPVVEAAPVAVLAVDPAEPPAGANLSE